MVGECLDLEVNPYFEETEKGASQFCNPHPPTPSPNIDTAGEINTPQYLWAGILKHT
jgi:hypothetical protein